jgi:hypothetical protein
MGRKEKEMANVLRGSCNQYSARNAHMIPCDAKDLKHLREDPDVACKTMLYRQVELLGFPCRSHKL